MLTMIAAVSKNKVIGSQGTIPWNMPTDYKRYLDFTSNHKIIVGRKTFSGMRNHGQNREYIVLTHDEDYVPEHPRAKAVHTVEQAIQGTQEEKVFVIGGGEIYELLMPYADEILLTVIERNVHGDVLFPDINLLEWRLLETEAHAADKENPSNWSYLHYVRMNEN